MKSRRKINFLCFLRKRKKTTANCTATFCLTKLRDDNFPGMADDLASLENCRFHPRNPQFCCAIGGVIFLFCISKFCSISSGCVCWTSQGMRCLLQARGRNWWPWVTHAGTWSGLNQCQTNIWQLRLWWCSETELFTRSCKSMFEADHRKEVFQIYLLQCWNSQFTINTFDCFSCIA